MAAAARAQHVAVVDTGVGNRHLEHRRRPAGGRGLRAGREILPLGMARRAAMEMGVDDPGQH